MIPQFVCVHVSRVYVTVCVRKCVCKNVCVCVIVFVSMYLYVCVRARARLHVACMYACVFCPYI